MLLRVLGATRALAQRLAFGSTDQVVNRRGFGKNRAMSGRVSATGAQTSTRRAAFRARLSNSSRAALGRRAGRIQLFPAVTLALLAGLGIAFIAYWFLRRITPVDVNKTAAEIDVTRVALTVVAGVGGVVALVIAYRRQRDLEQSRFVERFGAAAAQLGATDVAVRIAGVYAMAGVADESDGLRRQQCIDVLCGYLRLPYSPELGANHQSKLVLKHHRATADGTRADDQERHLEYRHNDREVRATIIRVIADRLRPTAEYSWSANDFDFRTAHLEHVDLSYVKFAGTARFSSATFSGPAAFVGATFTGTTEFRWVTFSASAGFTGATFAGTTSFDFATFSGKAAFDWAAFSGPASFVGATFAAVEFRGVTFSAAVGFTGATFTGTTLFPEATFAAAAEFRKAAFAGVTSFSGVAFAGPTNFRRVIFSGPVSFAGTDFGASPISFVLPEQWGPPPPIFDWDADISQKPANVEPQHWPPTVTE